MYSSPYASTTAPPCCTIPIVVVLAIGCVAVVAAFTGVTTYTGLAFSSTVEDSVNENLNLALRGALQAIIKPLAESEEYIDRLRDKIEFSPSMFGLDDSNTTIAGNPSLHGFYVDAMSMSLQRPDILYIYQMRQSDNYEHAPGHAVDTIVSASGPTREYNFAVNNTLSAIKVAASGNLSDFSSAVTKPFSYNASEDSYLEEAYATADKRWDNAPYTFGNTPTTNLMSLYAKIRGFPGGAYALGLDIDMAKFADVMKQATPPFTIGVENAKKDVADGAHTSLYDISGSGFLMTTSAKGVVLYKSDEELWPAGEVPSSSLNSAYAKAVSLCDGTCGTTPLFAKDGDNLISIIRHSDASLNLDLLLVSSIPRHYFFDHADRSLYVSIGVAAACCLLVIVGCVLLVLCITPSLHNLEANMLLAADLKNDRVEHTHSILTDIAKLSSVFDEMNKRLMVARSFVPEAVLLGQESTKTDANIDEEEDTDDEGGSSVNVVYQSVQGSASTTKTSVGTPTPEVRVSHMFVMSEKRIAVLALNLVGFNGVLDVRGISRPQRINDVSARLLTIVVDAAKNEKGVMDSFHGDHFILTYNASRAVGSALAAAIRTASMIEEEVKREPLLRGSIGIAAGAAVGKAHIGTLGIDAHRRFSIVGPVYRTAISYQAIATDYMRRLVDGALGNKRSHMPVTAGCMVDESTFHDLSNCGMYMQLVGRSVTLQGTDPVEMYAAHFVDTHSQSTPDDGGEWLYELDAMEAGDPFTEPNRAMTALMCGDMDLCKSILSSHTRKTSITSLDYAGGEKDVNPAWAIIDMYYNQATSSASEGEDGGCGGGMLKPYHYVR